MEAGQHHQGHPASLEYSYSPGAPGATPFSSVCGARKRSRHAYGCQMKAFDSLPKIVCLLGTTTEALGSTASMRRRVSMPPAKPSIQLTLLYKKLPLLLPNWRSRHILIWIFLRQLNLSAYLASVSTSFYDNVSSHPN